MFYQHFTYLCIKDIGGDTFKMKVFSCVFLCSITWTKFIVCFMLSHCSHRTQPTYWWSHSLYRGGRAFRSVSKEKRKLHIAGTSHHYCYLMLHVWINCFSWLFFPLLDSQLRCCNYKLPLSCILNTARNLLCFYSVSLVWGSMGVNQHCFRYIQSDTGGDPGRSCSHFHRDAQLRIWRRAGTGVYN